MTAACGIAATIDCMALPSEVRRIQAAIENNNKKELEWSLWYARMRQTVPSARPADVKYWSAVESEVSEILNPPAPARNFPTRKKKPENRGLGLSPLPGEEPTPEQAESGRPEVVETFSDPTFRAVPREYYRKMIASVARPIKRKAIKPPA